MAKRARAAATVPRRVLPPPVVALPAATPKPAPAERSTDRIAAFRRTRPAAAELAVLLSLAARVEPELIRSMRLRVLPSASVTAEADLWFSDLIASRSSLFAIFDPEVAARLREELAKQPDRLARAWRIVEKLHAAAPPAVRLEEEITWRTLVDPRDPKIGALFESVLSGLHQTRPGLARWAARALPRLPASAQQRVEAWHVAAIAGSVLGGPPILAKHPPKGGLRSFASRLNAQNVPTTPIGVRLFSNALRLSEPPESASERIEVPRLNPILVEVSSRVAGREARQIVSIRQGTIEDIPLRELSDVRLLTSDLVEYSIRSAQARTPPETAWMSVARSSGLTVTAYRGARLVMLAFDLEQARTKDFAGFAVTRTDPRGELVTLPNRMNYEGAPGPQPSTIAPIQRFHWFDEPPEIITGSYTYGVSVMHRAPGGLAQGASVNVSLDLVASSPEYDVGFTRPHAAERREGVPVVLRPDNDELLFDTAPYQGHYVRHGGHARVLLHDFLGRAAAANSRLVVLAHELDEPDVIRAFMAMGGRVKIVIPNAMARGLVASDQAADALRKAGCHVRSTGNRKMANASFAVRIEGDQAVEVLTGSAGFSLATLYERQSHVMIVRHELIAEVYRGMFDELFIRGGNKQWREADLKLGAGSITVTTTPAPHRVDFAKASARSVASSAIFAMHQAADPDLLRRLRNLVERREPLRPMGVGLEAQNGVDALYWDGRIFNLGRVSPARTKPSPLLRFNVLATDFNRSQAVAVIGASTFSHASAAARGGSFVTLRGPALVTPFAIEVLRILDEHVYHARAEGEPRTGRKLDSGFNWWPRYYIDGHPAWARRRAMTLDAPGPAASPAPSASPRTRAARRPSPSKLNPAASARRRGRPMSRSSRKR